MFRTIIAAMFAATLFTAPAHAGFGQWLSDTFGYNIIQTQPGGGGGGYSANAGQYYREAYEIRKLPNADTPENKAMIRSLEGTGQALDRIFGTNSRFPPSAKSSAKNADTKFGKADLSLSDSANYPTPNTISRAEKDTKKAKKAKDNLKSKVDEANKK